MAVVVVDTDYDNSVVGFDIDQNPVFEHFLVGLSMRS